jgi:5-methylcytosine-specific restriction endonuclease McrA
MKSYNTTHYQENRTKRVQQAIARRQRHSKFLNLFILEYFETHPCVDCPESDPIVLDFDHRENKEFDISVYLRSGGSLKKLVLEIAKCDVRCANCHRRKTAKERGYQRYLLTAPERFERSPTELETVMLPLHHGANAQT